MVGALGVSMLFVGPGEIRLNADGIVQRGLFWSRPRKIAWVGLAVNYNPALKQVLLIGIDGTTVTHGEYHVDQLGFVRELRR
jgi:hypothetical protein